jgi:hypothetical protein
MKSVNKSKKRRRSTDPPENPKKSPQLLIAVLVATGLAVLIFLVLREWPTNQSQLPIGRSASDAHPGSAAQFLKGRWLRPDGGYVLEIRNVKSDGQIEAAYFNPRPIHVAIAKMSQSGPATKVFVELRDTGYPGSAYNLVYDLGSDQLKGVYSQAAIHQDFDVYFVRMKQ